MKHCSQLYKPAGCAHLDQTSMAGTLVFRDTPSSQNMKAWWIVVTSGFATCLSWDLNLIRMHQDQELLSAAAVSQQTTQWDTGIEWRGGLYPGLQVHTRSLEEDGPNGHAGNCTQSIPPACCGKQTMQGCRLALLWHELHSFQPCSLSLWRSTLNLPRHN